MDAHSLSSCALKFPDEPGLYYIDVATSSHEASDIFQQLITHFYAAIQIGEEKVDEPVTPPTYPEPEINLPDIQTHATILSGRWVSDDYDPHRYCLVFHQDGRVYIMDLSNKTSETGRYSWEEDHIDINTHDIATLLHLDCTRLWATEWRIVALRILVDDNIIIVAEIAFHIEFHAQQLIFNTKNCACSEVRWVGQWRQYHQKYLFVMVGLYKVYRNLLLAKLEGAIFTFPTMCCTIIIRRTSRQ
jgi:hypothetical protein